jgi:hypothetical protein
MPENGRKAAIELMPILRALNAWREFKICGFKN